ncbi:MAG TPA: hypothetical protein VGE09_06275 [Pseudoxanthomonas sp.]
MATTWCPELSGDPAIALVGAAHDKFFQQGTQTYNLAIDNLNALDISGFEPISFSIPFDFNGQLTPFHRPTRPTFDDAALEFRDPGMSVGPAPEFNPAPLQFDPAPEIDATAPTLTYQARPSTPTILAPIAPSRPGPLAMPDSPDYVLPQVPTFESLNLPSVPNIDLPEFQGQRPQYIEPPFNENWTFNPQAYEGVLVDTLVETLRPMIVGSPALPRIIEDAIFQRGRSQIELETNRSVDQAFADTANRGFSLPQGVTIARAAELRQGGQNAIAVVARDVMIKQFEETLASQRFAITTGAALEGTLGQLHVEGQRFLLEAARLQMDSAVAVLNYRSTAFNMQLQAYQVDASVLESRIRGELAKVEVFRAQIEGERARGEINEQRVRLYVGQLQGVQALADFYRNRVEAVKVQADVQMQEIERYRAEVQAFSARWDAHATEWKGYIASVEGEGRRADVYRTLVDANAKRVDAWAASNNMKLEAERLVTDQHRMKVDVWSAGLRRWEAGLTTERSRLAAVAQAIEARSRIYMADADIEQAASAASDRSFQLGLERARAVVETQLQQARMRVEQALAVLTQWVEIGKAKANIAAQLAASTMSAVNYGASVSSGRSKSNSCSSNYSFQGEIADA